MLDTQFHSYGPILLLLHDQGSAALCNIVCGYTMAITKDIGTSALCLLTSPWLPITYHLTLSHLLVQYLLVAISYHQTSSKALLKVSHLHQTA